MAMSTDRWAIAIAVLALVVAVIGVVVANMAFRSDKATRRQGEIESADRHERIGSNRVRLFQVMVSPPADGAAERRSRLSVFNGSYDMRFMDIVVTTEGDGGPFSVSLGGLDPRTGSTEYLVPSLGRDVPSWSATLVDRYGTRWRTNSAQSIVKVS